jgi:hypothetical protein
VDCGPGMVCDTTLGCVECVSANDCPATGNECIVPTCNANVCGTSYLGNSHVLSTGQITGDCQKRVCDGAGGTTLIADTTDLPTSNSVCLINPACVGNQPHFDDAPDGTSCNDVVNGHCTAGVCVGCFPDTTTCSHGYECCSGNCSGTCFTP